MNRQAGFSIEWILLLIIAGLIGYTGWSVFNSNHKAAQSLGNAESSSAANAKHSVNNTDPAAGWKSYTSSSGHYTFKYPPTWVRGARQEICGSDTILLGPTVQAAGQCSINNTSQVMIKSVAGDKRSDYDLSDQVFSDIHNDVALMNDLSGTRQSGLYAAPPQSEGVGPPDGSQVIIYTLLANGRTYILQYTQAPNFPDVSGDFDLLAAKEFKIN